MSINIYICISIHIFFLKGKLVLLCQRKATIHSMWGEALAFYFFSYFLIFPFAFSQKKMK